MIKTSLIDENKTAVTVLGASFKSVIRDRVEI